MTIKHTSKMKLKRITPATAVYVSTSSSFNKVIHSVVLARHALKKPIAQSIDIQVTVGGPSE